MNANTQVLELDVEGRQVDEAVLSLFHTLLFHRSTGKFHYKNDDTYAVGTIGFQDVDCDFIDFTYVRCSSEELDRSIKREVSGFCEAIRAPDAPSSGQVALEFYQRKRGRWPFATESIPWEVWTLRINVVSLNNEHERQIWRERVGDSLGERLLHITDTLNRHDYIPSPPNQAEIDLIYDTAYPDVQPFLFKINYSVSAPTNPSATTTIKKLIRDTLALT
ncbi:autophagy-related protein 101-like [Penaeus monodon]|nr:autophagy-related protein 101-like [Penaeus monodon]XP_047482659.1 autophagy-related protein 101-like [Penaeus chinensis]